MPRHHLRPVDEQFTARAPTAHEMAEELREAHEAEQLSKWEQKFMDNIYSLLELEEPLTEMHLMKLKEIYGDYIE